jgi:AcrR family transcriptional regulator
LTERCCNENLRVMVRLQISGGEDQPRNVSASHIKAVAQRLFAERGVDGVTVREIATAAGQKNHGAVGYYFGSKEALVREIIVDGAAAIDARRNTMLDRLEQGGGPHTVREVVNVLIFPAVAANPGEGDYIRFITMLAMTHRDLMMDVLGDQLNVGYRRCLDHLRRLMPDMAPSMKNQRFIFVGNYLNAVLSARQRALADESRRHPTWVADETLDHFARSVVAIIEMPPTSTALATAETATDRVC